MNLPNPPSATSMQEFNSPSWQNWFLQVATKVKGLLYDGPTQYTTASAPPYKKGAMYFDTTLNKLRIGGATHWETVTSV
jgi:hypothetical protein